MGRGGINMGNESSLCLSLREQLPSALPAAQRGQELFRSGRAGEAEPGCGPKGAPRNWVSVFASNTP